MGKKISELTNRQQLSGNEDLPFQEGQDNGSITIHSLNEYISNSNVNQAINQIKQAEQQAISNFSSQKVSPEMLSESTKQLINASGGGTITNLADDEDIESVGQDLKVLKFADRAYNPDRFSGKGYKILRRNIVGGKNILTQEMINQPDTIYEITPYFYINPGKNYGFEIYRESPNGKKEVVVGFSSVNDVETLSFQDFSDCALIGEHDSAWSSMKTSVLLWKPVKDDIPDKTLYPHFFYNQGVLVSTSGNLKSPLTDFLAIPYLNVGVTSQRPGNADNGFQFFDVTLRKPIWWNGSSWVDANGVSV